MNKSYPVTSTALPRTVRFALLTALIPVASMAPAHVNWTQANGPHPDLVAHYQFSEAGVLTVNQQSVAPGPGLSPNLALVPATPSPTTAPIAATSTDILSSVLGPRSLQFNSTQVLDTTPTLGNLSGTTGPLTIEGWFKWPTGFTSGTVTFGFRSGLRIQISRDTSNPANDRFGLAATHGSYVSAPGFTNWVDVGVNEAPIDEWLHVAATVTPLGTYFEPSTNHDHYTTGTVARLFLNGHLFGIQPNTTLNIGGVAGLQWHDPTRVRVNAVLPVGGSILVDEVSIWKRDWSQNGTVLNAFNNGRSQPAAVHDWAIYE
jgi:hypothetical protein